MLYFNHRDFIVCSCCTHARDFTENRDRVFCEFAEGWRDVAKTDCLQCDQKTNIPTGEYLYLCDIVQVIMGGKIDGEGLRMVRLGSLAGWLKDIPVGRFLVPIELWRGVVSSETTGDTETVDTPSPTLAADIVSVGDWEKSVKKWRKQSTKERRYNPLSSEEVKLFMGSREGGISYIFRGGVKCFTVLEPYTSSSYTKCGIRDGKWLCIIEQLDRAVKGRSLKKLIRRVNDLLIWQKCMDLAVSGQEGLRIMEDKIIELSNKLDNKCTAK